MSRSSCPIPGIDKCIRLMDQYRMLPNIRHHSLVVAQVADALLSGLDDGLGSGLLLNRKLVIAGALLHDIAKTPCLDTGCDHALLGGQICEEHGFPEVGAIVREHVILAGHDPARQASGVFTEREIVYYADKRVRHERVVSLGERLTYIIDHYAHNDPGLEGLIRENFQRCLDLERNLFAVLDFSPGQLEQRIRFPRPPVGREFDPWD